MSIANWDDVRRFRRDAGHIAGEWRDLGRAVGSREIGLRRIHVDPDRFSTPVHVHAQEEEIFYVLRGDGVLWQGEETFAVGEGDAIVHRPSRQAHTLRAGPDGLEVLAFGQRSDPGLTYLPRAGVSWNGRSWVESGGGDEPFVREGHVGPPECPPPSPQRPRNVIALESAPSDFGGAVRRLGSGGGSVATGLNHVRLEAGREGVPPHCHSAEEELFVVLEGDGSLVLHPRGDSGEPEAQPLRAGSVVSRLPGTGIAHSLQPGPRGITYLAYGMRVPDDMCFYPLTGRVSLRGLGIALRAPEIERLS